MNLKEGDNFALTEDLDIPCPFCGQQFLAGMINGQDFGVLHMMPQCARFQDLDPLEFLKLARETLESRN